MEDNKDKIVGNKVKESKGAKIFRIAQSCLMISQIVLETLILIVACIAIATKTMNLDILASLMIFIMLAIKTKNTIIIRK